VRALFDVYLGSLREFVCANRWEFSHSGERNKLAVGPETDRRLASAPR
jgi:hypothetical protein